MKRFAFYIGMTAALVASCSTKEKDFRTPVQDDVVFYASLEQPSEGARVYVNRDLLLRWTADDRVSIFNKNTYNQQYQFTGETGDNAGGFRKVDSGEFVTGNPISHVVSVYPYQETTKITEAGTLTLNLPSEQHYAENTFGLGANTMVSVSSDNFLQYKNVGGFLRLRLYGEGVSVSSITLKGDNGEKLAGKAAVTMPLNGTPDVTLADDAADAITLVCDTPVILGATEVESKDFWFVVPPVTFNKGFTVSVNQTTGSVFEKSTSKSITIGRNSLSKMSPMEVEGGTPATPVPEAIDLGLPSGLKWASFNLGASKPEEYGDHFAWGETEPKSNYYWSTYKWCMGSENMMTKYCNLIDYGYNGFTDDKSVLDPEDDAAHVNLGGKWRMPTEAEITELKENCTWEWTFQNGVNGRLVTGPNGNCIFLPAAGYRGYSDLYNASSYGHYWSSSLYTVRPDIVNDIYFNSSKVGWNGSSRSYGFSVRPVYDDSKPEPEMKIPEAVDLGLPSGVKWASFNLGASKPEELGNFYAWGETEPKDSYGWVNYKWCNGDLYSLTKYNSDSGYGIMDNLTMLESADDAAAVHLGDRWRMPTHTEQEELRTECDWIWSSREGVNGYLVQSKTNGNRIFLPLVSYGSGGIYGELWSSSKAEGVNAYSMLYSQSSIGYCMESRCYLEAIRPVFGESVIPVVSLSLDKNELRLSVGETATLTALISPTNATYQTLHWACSDESIATVSLSGVVKGVAAGSAEVVVYTTEGLWAICKVIVSVPYTAVIPEAIDLGLPSGLKWASFNLGASKPEEFGDYYAWGETEPYYSSVDPLVWKPGKEAGYSWASYKWCMGSNVLITKYCNDSSNGYNGYIDNKVELDPEDDAARVNLGGGWRMPTMAEVVELTTKCTWEWTSINDVIGQIITGPNGKSIFLPAAGTIYYTTRGFIGTRGCYWSTTLCEPTVGHWADKAHILEITSSMLDGYLVYSRFNGVTIRPVYDSSTGGGSEGIGYEIWD